MKISELTGGIVRMTLGETKAQSMTRKIFKEFSRVELRIGITREGVSVPARTKGVIVDIYGKDTYVIEIATPIQGTVTVYANEIKQA